MVTLDLKIKADLQRLVDEALEESLTLDYKASPALTRDGKGPDELCKDATALANSAGGQLVYGIEEDKVTRKPSRVDDGIIDPKITREWMEQILNSRVQPRLNGVQTTRIDMENGKFGYVILVPQSQTGPHQAPDQKYYKRFDLQSVPMHDYEIKDIMRRATTPDLYTEITFDNKQTTRSIDAVMSTGFSDTVVLHCTVKNRSSAPAYHVIIDFLIDYDLAVPFALNPFKQVGERDQPPGPKMKIFRRAINSPPHLPIFREGESEDHTAPLAIQIPNSVLNSGIIWLETSIQAPGVSSTERWTIQTRHSVLTLYPPGNARNR
jgi:Schlafen, AlbA_2